MRVYNIMCKKNLRDLKIKKETAMEGRVRCDRRVIHVGTYIEICQAAGCNDQKFAKKPNARNNSMEYSVRERE